MATILERRGKDGKAHYLAQVRLKGHPTQCATFARKTDAKAWAQEQESAIKAGRHLPVAESKRRTVAEMIDRYVAQVLPHKAANTRDGQGRQFRWWRERLGRLVLADVTPGVIADARDALAASKGPRTKRPPSAATITLHLAALSHCFTVAMQEWGWCDDNPCRRVRKPPKPRGRVRFLSEAERDRLLDACRQSQGPDLYDIVVIALSTGMRRNEILHLQWTDVELDRNMLTLHDTKNKERRAVPLVGHALDVLRNRAKMRRMDTDLVFPAPFRNGQSPRPIDCRHAWDKAVERSKIEDFRFHDLRHTAASYLLMSGATLGELAEILGHKTLQMVRRYSHISQPHAAGIVERMNATWNR